MSAGLLVCGGTGCSLAGYWSRAWCHRTACDLAAPLLYPCRKVVEEVLRCKEQGLPIPEHLLPKPKKEKKPKEAKKK